MNPFKKLKAYLVLRKAIERADEAFAKTGDRQYVMPWVRGKVMVFDRDSFRKLKHDGIVNNNMRVFDLERLCYYATPYRDGKRGLLSPETLKMKRISYYRWALK